MTVEVWGCSMTEAKSLPAEVIVNSARQWIGTKYIHQQYHKGLGTDCVGLIRGIYAELVGPVKRKLIPNYSPWWAEEGNHSVMVDLLDQYLIRCDPADRRPGLVLTFSFDKTKPIKHAGIMSYDGNFIHTYDRNPVNEVHLAPWWDKRVRATFAFPGYTE